MNDTLPANAAAATPPPVSAVTSDPLIDSLLAKRRAGERLSPAENGKLGAWSAKSGTKLPGRPRQQALASALPQAQAAASGPESIAAPLAGSPESDIIRDTTAAVLATVDNLAVGWVEGSARDAGVSSEQAKTLAERCRLQESAKNLMVSTSPAVVASLGVQAGSYPIAAFTAGALAYVGSLGLVVKELRDLKREQIRMDRERFQRRRQEAAAAGSGAGGVTPTP